MRHARRAPAPPGDVPAHRASPQFKPRAGVLTRGRTRGHDGRSHRGARSFVRFLRGGAPPARSRARAVGVSFVPRLFFPHTTHRSCTAADQGRQRRQGGGGGTRRGAPRCGGGVRRARRHQGTGGGGEAQGTEEEGGGCQPADGARPGASPFSPHPASRRSRPRRGGRCPPSFGAHDTTRDVRDIPGASRAHLDVRAWRCARSLARAPSTTRARPARAPRPRSPTLRSPNFSKLARWRALAWTAGF